MLGERRDTDPPLPEDLRAALREWARFARSPGADDDPELVRRRGRQLAARTAEALGRPVEYLDPVTGSVERVPVGAGPWRPPGTDGPTPWATGLPAAGFFVVLVAVADLTLGEALAASFGLLWVPANVLVGVGLAPALWLARRTPFWRWPALGAAVGLLVAWVVLLLGQLGP